MKSVGPRAVLIPSSNDPDIMAGQGTIALELFEQVSHVSHAKSLTTISFSSPFVQ